MKVTNYLLGYKDLKIVQDNEMFNFSLDSVLLPNFVTLNQKIDRILDIGCGNAPIPLILSTKTNASITGVEIQKEVYDLALESVKINKNDYKTIARHEVKLNLNQLFSIAKKLLKNNGVIAIVHRPERFVEVVEEMKKNNIEPKRVQFVYPKKNMEANIMLIEGSKNGKPGLKILPPIYSHKDNGEYTEDVKKYFE